MKKWLTQVLQSIIFAVGLAGVWLMSTATLAVRHPFASYYPAMILLIVLFLESIPIIYFQSSESAPVFPKGGLSKQSLRVLQVLLTVPWLLAAAASSTFFLPDNSLSLSYPVALISIIPPFIIQPFLCIVAMSVNFVSVALFFLIVRVAKQDREQV